MIYPSKLKRRKDKNMDNLDPEIQAMAAASKALDPLDDPAKHRVINWLSEKYGTQVPVKTQKDEPSDKDEGHNGNPASSFTQFAELFNAFDPTSDSERLLVGAYWYQVIEGNGSWYSVSINKLLKPTGYGIGKISRVLSTELKQRPAKIIQLKRTGTNQQAKKACKLTDEGIKFVEARLKD
jgi:hypothetical protein